MYSKNTVKQVGKFSILEPLVGKDQKFKSFVANNITETVGNDNLLKAYENVSKNCFKRSSTS